MPRLKNQGTVKVFFSSPFGGMEEEREELTRRYFPQIRHLCNSYGLQFAAVDMRWGITSESSANAQVINICLREIDRSDMFIGFFGQVIIIYDFNLRLEGYLHHEVVVPMLFFDWSSLHFQLTPSYFHSGTRLTITHSISNGLKWQYFDWLPKIWV